MLIQDVRYHVLLYRACCYSGERSDPDTEQVADQRNVRTLLKLGFVFYHLGFSLKCSAEIRRPGADAFCDKIEQTADAICGKCAPHACCIAGLPLLICWT